MLRAGIWAFVGRAGNQIVNLVALVVLARLLTPEAFGIVAAAQVILTLSQVVVTFGIGTALIQTQGLTRRTERTAQTLMFCLALLISGILFLFSGTLASLLKIPEIETIMPLIILSFVLSSMMNVSRSLIARDMDFRYLSLVEVSTFAVGYGVVAVTLAFLGFSYWSIIVGTVVQSFMRFCIFMRQRPVWPTLDLHRAEIKPLLHFGGGTFLSQMMSNAAQRADNIIVASLLGPAALGFYSRAFSLMELSNQLLGNAFTQTLFAGFSKQQREGFDDISRGRAFLMAHAVAAFLILPISITMFVLADEIVSILLGSQWGAAAPVLRVLAIGMWFRLAYKVSHSFNLAAGKVYQTAAILAVYALAVLVGAYFGALRGLPEVALGVLSALALNFAMLTILSMRHVAVSWAALGSTLAPFFAAAAPAALASYAAADALRQIHVHPAIVILGSCAALAVTYGGGLLLLRRSEPVHQMLVSTFNLLHGLNRKYLGDM